MVSSSTILEELGVKTGVNSSEDDVAGDDGEAVVS